MDLLGISQAKFFSFFLILLRLGGLFTFAPVYGTMMLPMRVKAAAVLGISVCLSVLGLGGPVPVPATTSGLAFFAVQEVLLGFLLGFATRLVFAAVEFGGQLVGLQMGLGIVSILDPQFETQVSILSQLQFLLATLLFLAVGGDRMLLEAFAANLDRIPPGHLALKGPVLGALVTLAGEIFRLGLQLSAPVVVALLATQVILGVFARSMPQMNMLILGFPLQILFGFGVLGFALPHWSRTLVRAFSEMFEALRGLAALLH
ncbi:MAG: flagellar biosynthetic protein FliR [Deltaproteobacteria bacterium]|nr:flagellar biosynthetic protein FliR [Deltaproteobacteria bacterium]